MTSPDAGRPGPIATLTANPSVDRTIEVDRLERGAVLRATGVRVEPGGKGVNVARALAANGTPARAVLPCGGAEGDQLVGLLAGDATAPVEVVTVPIARPVRANVTVTEPDGTTTKLNEPGPVLDAAELDALARALLDVAAGLRGPNAGTGAAWVVLSGTLPPGAPDDLYATLIERLHAIGVRVALDTSGAALARAVAAGPDLIKPNQDELASLVGQPVNDLGTAVTAAAALRDRTGIATVLCSLGAAGAVLVDESGASGALHAEAPRIVPRSTVGAGDAALAGFLHAGGAGAPALITAVAWGSAATALPGSRPPGPTDIDATAVLVHTAIDHPRRLKGDLHHVAHLR
jgi:1-phosphofructokinase